MNNLILKCTQESIFKNVDTIIKSSKIGTWVLFHSNTTKYDNIIFEYEGNTINAKYIKYKIFNLTLNPTTVIFFGKYESN